MQINANSNNIPQNYSAIGQPVKHNQSPNPLDSNHSAQPNQPAAVYTPGGAIYTNDPDALAQREFGLADLDGISINHAEEMRAWIEKLKEEQNNSGNPRLEVGEVRTMPGSHLSDGRLPLLRLSEMSSLESVLNTAIFKSNGRLPADFELNQNIALARMLDAGFDVLEKMSSAQERALQREAIVRMAEEIAATIIEEDEFAQWFLDNVKVRLGFDFGVEQGFIVRDDGCLTGYSNSMSEPLPTAFGARAFMGDVLSANDLHRYNEATARIHAAIAVGNHREMMIAAEVQFGISFLNGWLGERRLAWTFDQSRTVDPLASSAHRSFDTLIHDPKFAAVNQWQKSMQELLNASRS
ncbi:MAG: hypothetical protein FWE32_00575 [Oscillospiraceae bacterium]|nr:hypothetical protein [Oscillospiraceae bacterium]